MISLLADCLSVCVRVVWLCFGVPWTYGQCSACGLGLLLGGDDDALCFCCAVALDKGGV